MKIYFHLQVFKEEEEAIKVDLHEGCGRAKLFWIMALADSSSLKAMLEFRESNQMMSVGPGAVAGAPSTTSDSFSRCRYCGAVSSTGDTVLNGVCGDKECVGHARNACQITLPCGHACGGIVDETECLPCLHGCAGGRGASRSEFF